LKKSLLFFKTLSSGIKRLNEISQLTIKENKSIVPGKLAFELYDTYGFPIDLTKLIAIENNLSVDEKEFQEYLNQQKIRSKKDAVKDFGDWVILREDDVQEFIGYDHLSALVKITQYRSLNIKNKTIYQLIFNLTPFYPEGGGQVGDIGMIHNDQEKIRITDTKKENGAIVHYVETLPKNINASFTAQVDENIRTKTIKNHSATHLLHYALRKVLGKHVEQKGSLVNSNNLRFDFSHFSKLTKKELFDVESEVNLQIRKAYPLQEDRNVPIEIAKQKGAMMLFGEKYGDSVRTIQFGESIELCGGIHVESSSLVGNFKLLSESSISSGIRRIEAVSDIDADQFVQDKLNEIDEISNLLKRPDNLVEAIQQLQKHNIELQKQLDQFIQSKIQEIKRSILGQFIDMNDISFLYKELDISSDQMKQIAFEIKDQLTNFVLVLTSVQNNKPLISVMISDNLVKEKNWNAGIIIRDLAKKIKGGGGGQAFFATAGGSDISGIKLVEVQAKEIFS
jgi:alanyl-tRNA synthetase